MTLKMCYYSLVKCSASGKVFFVRTMLAEFCRLLGEIQVLMKGRGKNRKKHNYACAVAIEAHSASCMSKGLESERDRETCTPNSNSVVAQFSVKSCD